LYNFLPKETSEEATNINPGIFIMPITTTKSYKGKEHILDSLMEALSHHRACTVTYNSFSTQEIKTYAIHPLKLLPHNGGLYVIVKIPKHDSINALAVERIQSIELLNKKFIPPPDSEISALLDMAFNLNFADPITAVIHFSARISPYICERRWSNRQSLEHHKDGSCTLTITTSGRNDLLFWILYWGSDAQLISPESLRKLLAAEIEKMGKIYESQALKS